MTVNLIDDLNRQLGLALLRAESEQGVLEVLDTDRFQPLDLSNPDNWKPLDGRDTNSNVVTNQASNGGKAATELITNMVDAMLTKRCLEEGIQPKGGNVPKTMYEAVDRFIYRLNGGKIINADAPWLREYAAKNLVIGITGKSRGGNPCYTFADNGEGQHPAAFTDTFLSLRAKNKSEIPFVQGKYNMGSSGVLGFCGEHWFKLILSRRYDKSGKWGWTLIRKHHKAEGMPYAEYFEPRGGIPTLGAEEKVFPFQKSGERLEEFSLESGTVVKLFDFYAGKNFRGFRGAREAFNENLVETILPFKILDFRWNPDPERTGLRAKGIDERPFYGMEFLLVRSHAADDYDAGDDVEADGAIIPVGTLAADSRLGKITVSAIVLKRESAKTAWYINSIARVFHHVNGQVQFKQSRGFLSQCGLPALKDRVVIFADASNLKDSAHQSVWKGDRENIRDTDIGERYKDEVRDIIKKSQPLRDLQHKIAREEIDSAAQESSKDLVKELVKRDKTLFDLLDGKYPDLPAPPIPQPPGSQIERKYSPTYIQFERRQDKVIELAVNRQRVVPCITDAVLDFFNRAENQGDLYFENDGVLDAFDFRHSYDNRERLLVTIRPTSGLVVGQEYAFKIGLKDDAMPLAVYTEEIKIKLVQRASPKPPVPPRPNPPTPPQSKGLPPHKLFTKDGREIIKGKPTKRWEDADCPNFGENDGGYVYDTGEGMVYNINYDNASFQSHLASLKNPDQKFAATEKYILGMRIAMLGAETALKFKPPNASEEFDDDLFRRMAAKSAAAVMLTLCEELPKSFDLAGDEGGE